jgi:hypothetical protein
VKNSIAVHPSDQMSDAGEGSSRETISGAIQYLKRNISNFFFLGSYDYGDPISVSSWQDCKLLFARKVLSASLCDSTKFAIPKSDNFNTPDDVTSKLFDSV